MSFKRSPFFILGNPRSGTTVLRLMLDSHLMVTVPPECGFLVWFYKKYHSKVFNSPEDVNGFIKDLKSARKIESWELNFSDLELSLSKMLPLSYADLVDAIYRYYAKVDAEMDYIWGDKNNFYIDHIKEITLLYPMAKFIHIVRDGRDVACSYKELNDKKIESKFAPILPTSIDEIAREWHGNNQTIIKGIETFTIKDRYHLVRYEDLITDTVNQLKSLTSFLDLQYEERMLLFHKNSKSYEPKEYLQWKANTKKPITAQSIGRYKKDLTHQEIKIFNKRAQVSLQRYHYEI